MYVELRFVMAGFVSGFHHRLVVAQFPTPIDFATMRDGQDKRMECFCRLLQKPKMIFGRVKDILRGLT